jgi:hypothetical protein
LAVVPTDPNAPDGRHDGNESRDDAEVRDTLPEDLDAAAAAFQGDYVFPDNSRRRVPAVLYLLIALALVILWALGRDQPLVNDGYLLAAGLLVAFGAYSYAAGWPLQVDERDALVASTAEVGFAVGHASAQMGWRGIRSRPTWRILLYSAEEPPTKRALVLVDGIDGEIIDRIVEDNPEDWSQYADVMSLTELDPRHDPFHDDGSTPTG